MDEQWADADIQLYRGPFKDHIEEAVKGFADEWKYTNAAQEGLRIWIARDYRALHYPMELYGEFFTKDVLLVLHTKTNGSNDPIWDLHIWIGKEVNKETYSTALYKANELDEHLNFRCDIHRHVEGHESEEFISYFKTLTFHKGDYTSSYWYLKNSTYRAKMLRVNQIKTRNFTINEVDPLHSELDPANIFIMDLGSSIYMRVGCLVDQRDVMEVVDYVQHMRKMRQLKNRLEIITESDESDNQHAFYTYLSHNTLRKRETMIASVTQASQSNGLAKLIKIANTNAGTEMSTIKPRSKTVTQADLDSCEMAIYDTGNKIFFKLGQNTDDDDKIQALELIHIYLRNTHCQNKIAIIYKGQAPESLVF